MAAGGALLIGGVITGAIALDRAGELRDRCPTNPCAPENESLADEANALATASTTLFVVGGVTTAVGLGWLIYGLVSDESTAEHTALTPVLAPGFMGVRGRYP
jgi:hypothetical protein